MLITTAWENKQRMNYLITSDSCTGEQVSSTLVLNFMTCLAAITGIHGVSSSEWFPISQSVVGKRKPLLGVMAFSWNRWEQPPHFIIGWKCNNTGRHWWQYENDEKKKKKKKQQETARGPITKLTLITVMHKYNLKWLFWCAVQESNYEVDSAG